MRECDSEIKRGLLLSWPVAMAVDAASRRRDKCVILFFSSRTEGQRKGGIKYSLFPILFPSL